MIRSIVLLLTLACTSHVVAEDKRHPSAKRWGKAIEKFLEQDKKSPFEKRGVVFVGSSSIRLWKLGKHFPKLKPLNRGFGGSEVADSLFFIEELVLKHKPRMVVMYAGDNDLHRKKTPKQVAADFELFIWKLHKALPKTKLLFIAVKPSTARWDNVANIRETNRLIARRCDADKRLRFVDIFSATINKDGKPRADLLVKDGLHLNEKGYAIWTRLVRESMKD